MSQALKHHPAPTGSQASAWAPLGRPAFRALWLATVVSNVGTWMHDVGAAWLMTSLSPSATMVALVQTATSLPMFLLVLPAGALADLLDRRRFLLAAQLWMMAAATMLAALAFLDLVDPAVLLLATAALGIGAALSAPSFQAIVAELVPRSEMPAAVALNSLGVNLSRAIGPALGGMIVAATSPAAVFALNAVSTVCVVIALLTWKREAAADPLPPERFLPGLLSGLRYALHAPLLQNVLVRTLGFLIPASATWALLPLVARRELGLDAFGYGVLLGCMGTGALGLALVLPRFRKRLGPDRLLLLAGAGFALATAVLALAQEAIVAGIALLIAGAAWLAALSTLNAGAQATSAGWVKARALSLYLVGFFGSMAVGSLAWGAFSDATGPRAALGVAALLGIAALLLARKAPLADTEALDLTASPVLGDAESLPGIGPDHGPVLVQIEYRVAREQRQGFLAAAAELRHVRHRAGASGWGLYADPLDPGRFIEGFTNPTWLAHQRQHLRMSRHDEELLAAARAYHTGDGPPRVLHLVGGAGLSADL